MTQISGTVTFSVFFFIASADCAVCGHFHMLRPDEFLAFTTMLHVLKTGQYTDMSLLLPLMVLSNLSLERALLHLPCSIHFQCVMK